MTSAVLELDDQAAADAAAVAWLGGVLPESFWEHDDDACDCTFQRIGMWTNPYIGETLEVRMCCIWKELYKLFPQHVRTTPAFFDYNADQWVPEPREWDGEADMPPAIWYRQLARKTGRSVSEVRTEYSEHDALRPRGVVKPVPEPEAVEEQPDIIAVMFEMIDGLAQEIASLHARLEPQS